MGRNRNSQGFSLGLSRFSAAASGTLTGTLQVPSVLQDLLLVSDQLGVVDTIRVAGQNIMCSSSSATLAMFAPEAMTEGERALGIPLDKNQQVEVTATLAGAGILQGCVNTDPIANQASVIPVNQLGEALDYVFGMGSAAPGAGADANLTATARRPCKLGRLVLNASATPIELTVRSILVNNIELLSGGTTAAGRECPLDAFDNDCTDYDGNKLAYEVGTNDTVAITVHNYSAGALTVRGGIFVMPRI